MDRGFSRVGHRGSGPLKESEETGEKCIMGNFFIFVFTKYCSKQIKETEISGACCLYGRKEKCIWGFDGDT